MVSQPSVVAISCLGLLANLALPLQAVKLHEAQDETLLRRAGQGAAVGEDDGRSGMVKLEDLMQQHRLDHPELHARAAEAFRRNFGPKVQGNGCSYQGGLLPCPNGKICYYNGVAGVNVSATVEYRGNIIKTILQADPDAGLDMPDLVTFMGASTNDEPAMLTEVPEEYRRTANPVLLKMFFVEDTDNVTEECRADNQRTEFMENGTVNYSVENNRISLMTETSGGSFMGMGFDFIREEPVGHTLAFEIPAGTEIVWVTREEMVQVLITQDLPASTQARLDEQLRRSARARGMDEALVEKGGRRRRRRRWCSGAGSMIGGAAAIGGAVALCVFTFIGCTVAAPFLTFVGTTATVNGACDCWNNKGTKSDTACELNGGR